MISTEQIIRALEKSLKIIDHESLDVVTFSGMGEPTLNGDLGEIIREVKKLVSVPLVILTNASLLTDSRVRDNLKEIDMIVAKLDAGDDHLFKRINRPVQRDLTVSAIKDGIIQMKEEATGLVATQSMLLSYGTSFSNTTETGLYNLVIAIREVHPDIIQLDTPYRPVPNPRVQSVPVPQLAMIAEFLSREYKKEDLWIYGLHDRSGKKVRRRMDTNLEKAILVLLLRRPCRVIDVSLSMGIDTEEAKKILSGLLQRRILKVEERNDQVYYRADES